MKNSVLLFLLVFFFLSCSKDQDDVQHGIIGKWQLMEIRIYGWEPHTTDYSDKEIIYTFRDDGILVVRGDEDSDIPDREVLYTVTEEALGDGGPEVLWVTIDGSRWMYERIHGTMILGTSYVDGPDLHFEKL